MTASTGRAAQTYPQTTGKAPWQVARIRSIKPDFFTSEVIVSLPLSARLTFIGLWTYVDDNGVGVDNDRLIVAAIWPLEDEPGSVLQRTREDLRSIARAGRNAARPGLITRYRDPQRRLIHITSWTEHQKISHPRLPRYPLPSDPVVTCENIDPPEDYRSPPETLRPEQGAGSREQGGIQSAPRSAAGKPRPPRAAPSEPTINQRSKAITDAYYEKEPMCKWPAVNSVVGRAIKDGRWSDEEIRAAILRMAADGRSVTVDSLRTELNGLPSGRSRPSTTDQRVAAIQSLKTRPPGALT